jgi:hypothetical protein
MNPSRRRVNILLSLFHPDEFVQLDLEPHRKVINQNKPYQWSAIAAKYGREEDLTWNLVAGDNIPGVLAVRFILYHKLNRILWAQCINQANVALLSRGRAFDIHAYRGVRLHPSEIDCTVRFDIDYISPTMEQDQQLFEFISLQEWFSTSNADIRMVRVPSMFKNGINAHLNSAALCVCRIAPAAVKVAASEPDEKAGFPLIFTFSLETPENFSDVHGVISATGYGDLSSA